MLAECSSAEFFPPKGRQWFGPTLDKNILKRGKDVLTFPAVRCGHLRHLKLIFHDISDLWKPTIAVIVWEYRTHNKYKDVQSIPNFNSFRTFTYHVESVPGPWDTLHPEHIRFFGHQRWSARTPDAQVSRKEEPQRPARATSASKLQRMWDHVRSVRILHRYYMVLHRSQIEITWIGNLVYIYYVYIDLLSWTILDALDVHLSLFVRSFVC